MIHKVFKNPRVQLKKYATIGDNLGSITQLTETESSKERKLAHMEGYLEKYFVEDKEWFKIYVILEKRNLSIFKSKPEIKDAIDKLIEKISLDNIVSLQRTCEGNQFELYEESEKMILKLRSKESDITKWLFNIQRNIAVSIPDYYEEKNSRSRRATVTNVRLMDQKKGPKSFINSYYSMNKGRRSKMEDLCLIVDSVNSEFGNILNGEQEDSSIYAVYDGHSGIQCATFLQKFLHTNLCTHPCFDTDLKKALEESFEKTDGEFRKWAVFNDDISGSTAILAMIKGDQLYVANCGDCRAVLFEENENIIPLSFDLKPYREDEKLRIEKAGIFFIYFLIFSFNFLFCFDFFCFFRCLFLFFN
eukprot:TRINITY_DN4146_c0_g1_i1.p1 TRINITY_DN4146_c0_g1~~TRINITY_DN4146_c0_g1_i1.p1  ORF type:complete len:361 (-),score=50.97 TRINITY_DN4146_c0_g1_i1:25-1107(-)